VRPQLEASAELLSALKEKLELDTLMSTDPLVVEYVLQHMRAADERWFETWGEHLRAWGFARRNHLAVALVDLRDQLDRVIERDERFDKLYRRSNARLASGLAIAAAVRVVKPILKQEVVRP
jgi:hypothetical protein